MSLVKNGQDPRVPLPDQAAAVGVRLAARAVLPVADAVAAGGAVGAPALAADLAVALQRGAPRLLVALAPALLRLHVAVLALLGLSAGRFDQSVRFG